jgi:hypothetical protein
MLGMATARKFCGLKAHFHGGAGVTCQFMWVLLYRQTCYSALNIRSTYGKQPKMSTNQTIT